MAWKGRKNGAHGRVPDGNRTSGDIAKLFLACVLNDRGLEVVVNSHPNSYYQAAELGKLLQSEDRTERICVFMRKKRRRSFSRGWGIHGKESESLGMFRTALREDLDVIFSIFCSRAGCDVTDRAELGEAWTRSPIGDRGM